MLTKDKNPVIIKGKSLLDIKEIRKKENINLTILHFLENTNKKPKKKIN